MTELSGLPGSEGYGDCDDAGVWGAFFGQDQRKPPRRFAGGSTPRTPSGVATEMLWQKKGVPGGSNQYTVLDYAVSEDGFVRGVILYRDAARLNEGNLVVYTETSATEISYGEADDVYRYTDKCSLEIRNGDTVSYYVEDYSTGEVINYAVKCSILEDGTKHFETVAGPQ